MKTLFKLLGIFSRKVEDKNATNKTTTKTNRIPLDLRIEGNKAEFRTRSGGKKMAKIVRDPEDGTPLHLVNLHHPKSPPIHLSRIVVEVEAAA